MESNRQGSIERGTWTQVARLDRPEEELMVWRAGWQGAPPPQGHCKKEQRSQGGPPAVESAA